MSKLAINGGEPVSRMPFPPRRFHNKEQIKNKICKVIDSGILSEYRGNSGDNFFGGYHVKEFEDFLAFLLNTGISNNNKKNKVLAVNSCTSALIVACGAIGLQKGDEVIVTPWSMSCSATAPMIYGATPVFADIDKNTFCLDPESVESKITNKTKAIIVVDLFGHPYDTRINEIAKKHNLLVIEDAAQAIGGAKGMDPCGTFGDIGCFSFTQGKNFHCGEGGAIVTKNEDLYMKCALIRNHAEAVISSNEILTSKFTNIKNMVGFNLRMTEIQAIIIKEQLLHYDCEIEIRNDIVDKLIERIKSLAISFYESDNNVYHAYYVLPFKYNKEKCNNISREKFINALSAELPLVQHGEGTHSMIFKQPPIRGGYITPLYRMPLFSPDGDFDKLPNVEELQYGDFCLTLLHSHNISDNQIDVIAEAFYKIDKYKDELANNGGL